MQVAACMHRESLQTMHFTIACARKNMYTRTVSQLLHSYFMHSYITRRGSRAAGQWLLQLFVHSKWASQSKLVCRCLSQTVFKTKSVTGGCIPSPCFGATSLLTKKMEAKNNIPKKLCTDSICCTFLPHARQGTSLYCSMDTMEAQVLRWEQAARHMASIQQVISI